MLMLIRIYLHNCVTVTHTVSLLAKSHLIKGIGKAKPHF